MPEFEADFHGWANEQAALLRSGRLSDADISGIAEEVESMGRGEKRELVDRLAGLVQHLLKWHAQPHLRGISWRPTIEEQRDRLAAHRSGVIAAQRETLLDRDAFPPSGPWTPEQVLDEGFYPA